MDADKPIEPMTRVHPAQGAFDRTQAAYAAKRARKVAENDALSRRQPGQETRGRSRSVVIHSSPVGVTASQTSAQREKLLYFVMLRQLETACPVVQAAYQRLADAASTAAGWDLRTVILDWLEAELRTLRHLGDDASRSGPQLMKAAVALSNALKQ